MLIPWRRTNHVLRVAFWFGVYKWVAPVSSLTRCIVKSHAGMWSVPCRCDYGEVWKKCAYNQVWTEFTLLFTEQPESCCSAECSEVLPQQLVLIWTWSWLLIAPFQVIRPDFLSQEKKSMQGECLSMSHSEELGVLQLRYSHSDRPCLKPMGVKHTLRSKP